MATLAIAHKENDSFIQMLLCVKDEVTLQIYMYIQFWTLLYLLNLS